MPMSTQLERNGESIGVSLDSEGKPCSWSWWHLAKLQDAIAEENPEAYDADGHFIEDAGFKRDDVGPFPYGYVFKRSHIWTEFERNIWRGDVNDVVYTFTVEAGDVYKCWR